MSLRAKAAVLLAFMGLVPLVAMGTVTNFTAAANNSASPRCPPLHCRCWRSPS